MEKELYAPSPCPLLLACLLATDRSEIVFEMDIVWMRGKKTSNKNATCKKRSVCGKELRPGLSR